MLTKEQILSLSNEELLNKTFISYLPDEIDGGYSKQHIEEGHLLDEELIKRLTKIGFLPKDNRKIK